jgi:hypothetical protein
MKQKKNFLLTFDYELFLGSQSGTAQKARLQSHAPES